MSFSALDSPLLGGLMTTPDMAALFSENNRIAAMLRVEVALARAHESLGLAPSGLSQALGKLGPDDFDVAELARGTALAGVPVIPFVKALQALLPPDLEPHVHKGATSQDIADSALVLIIRDALDLIAADLSDIIGDLSTLAETHRDTPCVGRSYGQQAAPISFGYRVAVWLAGIADAAAALPAIRQTSLIASYGGPVGSLAALGAQGPAALAEFARDLGLGEPPIAWHARRGGIVELGGWLARLMGALAKMATDVVALSATEVGEVSEPHLPGRGGSSAMPHKRNPISSTVILAAAQTSAGLAGSLFASMTAAQERPAGAWHAEWHALPQLFALAAGALREAKSLASGLVPDPARMSHNLALTRGLIFADAAAGLLTPLIGRSAAHQLVERAAERVRDQGIDLSTAILSDPDCPSLGEADLAAAFDPTASIEAAAIWVQRTIPYAAAIRARLAAKD